MPIAAPMPSSCCLEKKILLSAPNYAEPDRRSGAAWRWDLKEISASSPSVLTMRP